MPRTFTKTKSRGLTRRTVSPGFDPVFFTPTIIARQPDGSVVARAGKPVLLNGEDYIGTAEASRMLGCSPDWVGRLCDSGKLLEGEDWRRIGQRGNYQIKRTSILRLKAEKDGLQP